METREQVRTGQGEEMKLITVGSGSTGNCHLLKESNQVLILDAGVSDRDIVRALNYNIRDIQGVVVTHSHKDHTKAVSNLKLMGIPVLQPYLTDKTKVSETYGDFSITSFALKNQEGRWLHTNNDGSECPICGYLISVSDRKILYITDVMYCPYKFKKQRLHTIIVGCNYEDDIEIDNTAKNYHVRLGHSSLSTVKDIVKANRTSALRHVVLCHLSASADGERMVREVSRVAGAGVTVDIAEPGKTISLSDTPF